MRTWTVASAAVAPLAMIGGWTLAQSRQPPGYNPITQTISVLAGHTASDRWIMTTGLLLLGACYLVTAAGLPEVGRRGRTLLAAGGSAVIVVSFLPQPSSLHPIFAGISFVSLALWPAFALVPSARIRILVTAAVFLCLLWFCLQLGGGGHQLGLSERVLGAAEAGWPLALTLSMLAADRSRRLIYADEVCRCAKGGTAEIGLFDPPR